MSSPSDFATGSATSGAAGGGVAGDNARDDNPSEPAEALESVTPEAGGGNGDNDNGDNTAPDEVMVDDSLAELQRETVAMLRTLADRYEAESSDKRARAARLRTESEANDALASKLAEESARVRADADRLGTPPTWISGATSGDGRTEPPDGAEAAAPSDATPAATEVEQTHGEQSSAQSADASFSIDSARGGESQVPGPGPARGFAETSDQSAAGAQRAETTSTAESAGAPEDWAPKPFESWRNQTSRVIPRLLGL